MDLDEEEDRFHRKVSELKPSAGSPGPADDLHQEAEEAEAEEPGEDDRAARKREKKQRARSGNALFRLQLEEEERRYRQRQSKGLTFFDDEAEEEEEEGVQAGLGDFGFGSTSKLKENDEEREALKLRKGDLDHIVDSVSDDEGDEEAALKARIEMERREDKGLTRAIITGVTEGRDTAKQKQRKLGFSFEQLVGGASSAPGDGSAPDGQQSAAGGEEEEDYEELLLRGMLDRVSREKETRGRRGGGSDDEDEDGEDGAYDSDGELERMKELLSAMTEEERAAELEHLRRQKEREKFEAVRRRQIDKEFKIRRELRKRSGAAAGLELSAQPLDGLTASHSQLQPSSSASQLGRSHTNPAGKSALKDVSVRPLSLSLPALLSPPRSLDHQLAQSAAPGHHRAPGPGTGLGLPARPRLQLKENGLHVGLIDRAILLGCRGAAQARDRPLLAGHGRRGGARAAVAGAELAETVVLDAPAEQPAGDQPQGEQADALVLGDGRGLLVRVHGAATLLPLRPGRPAPGLRGLQLVAAGSGAAAELLLLGGDQLVVFIRAHDREDRRAAEDFLGGREGLKSVPAPSPSRTQPTSPLG